MNWISVKDRLPEEDSTKFIIFTEGVDVYCGRYYSRNSFNRESFFIVESQNGHIFNDSNVTHWMPLPDPPKDEK